MYEYEWLSLVRQPKPSSVLLFRVKPKRERKISTPPNYIQWKSKLSILVILLRTVATDDNGDDDNP